MTSPLFLELIRQLLRLLCVWIITMGLPPELARLVEHSARGCIVLIGRTFHRSDGRFREWDRKRGA